MIAIKEARATQVLILDGGKGEQNLRELPICHSIFMRNWKPIEKGQRISMISFYAYSFCIYCEKIAQFCHQYH